jgi:hypothetical protein
VPDVYNDDRCDTTKYQYKYKTYPRNLLIGPVMDKEGQKVRQKFSF